MTIGARHPAIDAYPYQTKHKLLCFQRVDGDVGADLCAELCPLRIVEIEMDAAVDSTHSCFIGCLRKTGKRSYCRCNLSCRERSPTAHGTAVAIDAVDDEAWAGLLKNWG